MNLRYKILRNYESKNFTYYINSPIFNYEFYNFCLPSSFRIDFNYFNSMILAEIKNQLSGIKIEKNTFLEYISFNRIMQNDIL